MKNVEKMNKNEKKRAIYKYTERKKGSKSPEKG